MFFMKVPSGIFHCLMLSAEAEAKINLRGCMHIPRTDFLWCVSVVYAFPAVRSQRRMVVSWDPVCA